MKKRGEAMAEECVCVCIAVAPDSANASVLA